jgi:hypothetical protein
MVLVMFDKCGLGVLAVKLTLSDEGYATYRTDVNSLPGT